MKTFTQFMQLAYVTNDFDRALDNFRVSHGVARFLEMRNMQAPTLDGRHADIHVGLAWASDTIQIELIMPLSGDDSIYRASLTDDAFSIRLHHIGQLTATTVEFARIHEESRAQGLQIVIDTPHYFYVDTRATLGHYIEYINSFESMTPELLAVRDSIPFN